MMVDISPQTRSSSFPPELPDSFDWYRRAGAFKRRLWNEVVVQVPNNSYLDLDEPAPFQLDTSNETIARCVSQFNDGNYRKTAGVYILECLQSPVPPHRAMKLINRQSRPGRSYYPSDPYQRVIYVGVAKHVPDRLNEHLNRPGTAGANFTAVYPPVRVLQIGWFHTYETARRAEPLVADLLSERFPNDFIKQL